MNNKAAKKTMILSFLSLILCIALLVGTTYAWFTDSVTSANNVIKAGNLDVKLEYSSDMSSWTELTSTSNVFDQNALWEPGYTDVVYLRISNIGSLALKYQLGVNIAAETAGTNQDGVQFLLSEHIKYSIVENVNKKFESRTDARSVAEPTAATLKASLSKSGSLNSKTATDSTYPSNTMAMVVYMPESVTSEVNHNGVNIPTINLGINLFATQYTKESDSFGTNYDQNAVIPAILNGSKNVATDSTGVISDTEIPLNTTSTNSPITAGSVTLPQGTKLDNNNVVPAVIPTDMPAANTSTSISASDTVISLDISINGLAADNDQVIAVELQMEAGKTGVEVYHNGTLMKNATTGADGTYSYDATTGILVIYSKSFSPFDIVYEKNTISTSPSIPADLPVAIVTDADEFENAAINWNTQYGYSPTDLNQQLESVYVFTAQDDYDTAQLSPYADWIADYYVSMDTDLETGKLVLGGNYGSFGWIGFENPMDVAADTKVPLLGSVGFTFTYEDIVLLVKEFTCGVADINNSLAGSTITVELRLTSPDSSTYYTINSTSYTFTNQ